MSCKKMRPEDCGTIPASRLRELSLIAGADANGCRTVYESPLSLICRTIAGLANGGVAVPGQTRLLGEGCAWYTIPNFDLCAAINARPVGNVLADGELVVSADCQRRPLPSYSLSGSGLTTTLLRDGTPIGSYTLPSASITNAVDLCALITARPTGTRMTRNDRVLAENCERRQLPDYELTLTGNTLELRENGTVISTVSITTSFDLCAALAARPIGTTLVGGQRVLAENCERSALPTYGLTGSGLTITLTENGNNIASYTIPSSAVDLCALIAARPTGTRLTANDAVLGANCQIRQMPGYSLQVAANTLTLLENGVSVSSVTLPTFDLCAAIAARPAGTRMTRNDRVLAENCERRQLPDYSVAISAGNVELRENGTTISSAALPAAGFLEDCNNNPLPPGSRVLTCPTPGGTLNSNNTLLAFTAGNTQSVTIPAASCSSNLASILGFNGSGNAINMPRADLVYVETNGTFINIIPSFSQNANTLTFTAGILGSPVNGYSTIPQSGNFGYTNLSNCTAGVFAMSFFVPGINRIGDFYTILLTSGVSEILYGTVFTRPILSSPAAIAVPIPASTSVPLYYRPITGARYTTQINTTIPSSTAFSFTFNSAGYISDTTQMQPGPNSTIVVTPYSMSFVFMRA